MKKNSRTDILIQLLHDKSQAIALLPGFFYVQQSRMQRELVKALFFILSVFFLGMTGYIECQAGVLEATAPKKKAGFELPAADPLEMKAEGKIRKVSGMVSGISPFGIGVEVQGDRDVWLDRMKETNVSGISDFKKIQYGDIVDLTYKEIEETKKKILMEVLLVKKKPPESPEETEVKPEADPADEGDDE